MANVVNCDFDRRPNYILSSAPVTKCAYMTIKGKFDVFLLVLISLTIKKKLEKFKITNKLEKV